MKLNHLVQLACASRGADFSFLMSIVNGKHNLMTAATLNDHILVFLQDDIALIEEI